MAASFSQLSPTRLFEEVLKEEVELAQDIQELGECAGPQATINGWNEVIHDKFKRIDKHLQAVKKLAAEQDKESQKKALLDQVDHHEARCKEYGKPGPSSFGIFCSSFFSSSLFFFFRLRAALRKAVIQTQMNLNKQRQQEHQLLLSGGTEAVKAREKWCWQRLSFSLSYCSCSLSEAH